MRPYQNCSYVDPTWVDKFTAANLQDFDKLWAAELPWVEEPNYRRGGWSGVARLQLDPKDAESIVYIKRQQNHIFRPWRHPKRGLPTFYREIRNILYFRMHGVPVVMPLFFDMRKHEGNQQAILITKALVGYQSLEDLLLKWQEQGFPNEGTCKAIVAKIATTLRKIHDLGYRHGAFKTKHIFVRYDEALETADISLLDFEVSRRVRYKRKRVMPDLVSVYFKLRDLPARYYYHFLKHYLHVDTVKATDFRLVRGIHQFKQRKHRLRGLRDCIFRRDRDRA